MSATPQVFLAVTASQQSLDRAPGAPCIRHNEDQYTLIKADTKVMFTRGTQSHGQEIGRTSLWAPQWVVTSLSGEVQPLGGQAAPLGRRAVCQCGVCCVRSALSVVDHSVHHQFRLIRQFWANLLCLLRAALRHGPALVRTVVRDQTLLPVRTEVASQPNGR